MKRWPTVPVAPITPTLIAGPSDILHMMEGRGRGGGGGGGVLDGY